MTDTNPTPIPVTQGLNPLHARASQPRRSRVKCPSNSSEEKPVPAPFDPSSRRNPSRKTNQQKPIDPGPFFQAQIVRDTLTREPLRILCLDQTPNFIRVEDLDGYIRPVSLHSVEIVPTSEMEPKNNGPRSKKWKEWTREMSHIFQDDPFGDVKATEEKKD